MRARRLKSMALKETFRTEGEMKEFSKGREAALRIISPDEKEEEFGIRWKLEALAEKGLIRLAKGKFKPYDETLRLPGRPLSEILIEIRE